jgi:hypothetical protein
MGIVEDGDEHFAGAMEAEGFMHQESFAVMVTAFTLIPSGISPIIP